jgi:hypothetical protein
MFKYVEVEINGQYCVKKIPEAEIKHDEKGFTVLESIREYFRGLGYENVGNVRML